VGQRTPPRTQATATLHAFISGMMGSDLEFLIPLADIPMQGRLTKREYLSSTHSLTPTTVLNFDLPLLLVPL
jgi:hypothetical protein